MVFKQTNNSDGKTQRKSINYMQTVFSFLVYAGANLIFMASRDLAIQGLCSKQLIQKEFVVVVVLLFNVHGQQL